MKRDSSNRFKRYERTPKGLAMRCYRNMKSRVLGIQKHKSHLYLGKELLSKEDFYSFTLNDVNYKNLFTNWVNNDFDQKLTPSIDRIDSDKGYVIDNMRWITLSENSSFGSFSRWSKE